MVGMGDGHLVSAELKVTASGTAATCAIKDRKAVSLSSGPVSLSTFTNNEELHVFAASDRPSVVYSRGNKLLYSSVNLKNVGVMAPFNSETFPECLALATEEELLIGTVDEVQKLHVRTVALGEAPRRICYMVRGAPHPHHPHLGAPLTTGPAFPWRRAAGLEHGGSDYHPDAADG